MDLWTWRTYVVLLFVAFALAVGRPAAANASGPFPILVMGDSYSAGNGAGAYVKPGKCYRSPKDYAALYAAALERPPYDDQAPLTNVACSGDTTNGFFAEENKQARQLDAVNQSYDLILLTTGGDDANFKSIVEQCLVYGTRDGQKCDSYLTAAEKLLDNGTLEARLHHVLSAIHGQANPQATIALLGYPYLEKDANYTLPGPDHKPVEIGKRLRALEDNGDAIQQRVVSQLDAKDATNSFVFVKTKKLFAGHELSASQSVSDPWFVAPFKTFSTSTWYHPNPTGWAEEAKLLLHNAAIPKQAPQPPPAPPPPPPPPPPAPVTVPSVGPTLVYDGDTAANPYEGDTGFEDWHNATGQEVQFASSLPSDISSFRCVVLLLNQSFNPSDPGELASYLQLGGTVLAIGEHSGNPEFEDADVAINQLAGTLGTNLSLDDDSFDEGDMITSNIDPSSFTQGVSALGYNWVSTVTTSGAAQQVVAIAEDPETTLIGEQGVGPGAFLMSGDSNLFTDNNDGFYTDFGNGQFVANICP